MAVPRNHITLVRSYVSEGLRCVVHGRVTNVVVVDDLVTWVVVVSVIVVVVAVLVPVVVVVPVIVVVVKVLVVTVLVVVVTVIVVVVPVVVVVLVLVMVAVVAATVAGGWRKESPYIAQGGAVSAEHLRPDPTIGR